MKKRKAKATPVPEEMTSRDSYILFLLCGVLFVGIFYSTALTTICTIGLVIFALRYFSPGKAADFIHDRTMMPFLLVFLSVFLTGSYSEGQEEWITALRIKLPFLILPFAFYILPVLRSGFAVSIHYWLLALSVAVGIPVLVHALGHQEEMLSLLSKGQPIPTPIEHVKYSMFNAYAAVSGLVLLLRDQTIKKVVYKWLIGLAITFMIVLLHILAVRTGLLILYISIFILGINFLLSHGDKKILWISLAAILIFPAIVFNAVPNLKQKIGYMRYDWNKYFDNQGDHYSDSERIMSYRAGIDIWKNNPIIGTGYGDVRAQAHKYYELRYNRQDLFKLPHSQLLLTLAGGGLLSFIIFLAGLYTPFLTSRSKSITGLLLVSLYLNYSISFLVENSLERSISVGYFVVLVLIIIKPEKP